MNPTSRLKETDSPCGQLPLSDAERERLADPSLAVVDATKELRESLQGLANHCRICFHLFFDDDDSCRDCGSVGGHIAGCNVKAISQLIARAEAVK